MWLKKYVSICILLFHGLACHFLSSLKKLIPCLIKLSLLFVVNNILVDRVFLSQLDEVQVCLGFLNQSTAILTLFGANILNK